MTVTLAYDSLHLDEIKKWVKDNEQLYKSNILPHIISSFDKTVAAFNQDDPLDLFYNTYVLFYFYRYENSKKEIRFLNYADDFLQYFNSRGLKEYYRDLNSILKESLDKR